jgi:signal transduction histidine kinase/ActR/RegA family two-component response regulator
MTDKLASLERRLERERLARKQAEQLLEEKSRELYYVNRDLQELASNLEELVNTRTYELVRARDAALAANRVKDAFLANMSHDIRTPMSGIIGMAELLLETTLSAAQRHQAQVVLDSSRFLLTLLNDILDLSKLTSGKLELAPVDFDLYELLDGIMDTLTIPASSKHLELGVMQDGTLPRKLHGDPARLRQVLLNLVGNAVKFTDSGAVIVHVNVQPGEPGSMTLRFDVTDTGPGIHDNDLGQLFMKFSQVDCKSTRRHQGTGLGLAISKDLVELMGGSIGVESEPGRGSTFWFTTVLQPATAAATHTDNGFAGVRVAGLVPGEPLRNQIALQLQGLGIESGLFADPAALVAALSDAEGRGEHYQFLLVDHAQLPQSIEQDLLALDAGLCKVSLEWVDDLPHGKEILWDRVLLRPVTWRKLTELLRPAAAKQTAAATDMVRGVHAARILLVEDAPALQMVTQARLERLGYQVEVADNGRQAVEAVEAGEFGLVLMDIQMPGMDGITATRMIRGMTASDKAGIPIIALTANAMKGDAEEYLAAGMNDYLTKPLDSASLADVLKHWLS